MKDAERALESAEGIERKGLVLATLMKLKQVCNHPAQFMGDNSAIAGRSRKLARLTEMLEEVISGGERTLVCTQFTAMGDILQRHLQETLGLRPAVSARGRASNFPCGAAKRVLLTNRGVSTNRRRLRD